MDLKLIRRDIGQITLAAGMTDDTIGWILLSVVSGLATSGTFNFATVLSSVGSAVLFLGVAFTVGRTVMAQVLRWCGRLYRRGDWFIDCAHTCALCSSAHAQVSLEAALGAFVLGILAGQSRRFSREAGHTGNYNGWLLLNFLCYRWLEGELATNVGSQTLMIGLLVLALPVLASLPGLPRCPLRWLNSLGRFGNGFRHERAARWRLSLRPSVSRWGTQPADVLDYRHGSNCNLADGSTAFALDTKSRDGRRKPTVCRKNRRAVALSKHPPCAYAHSGGANVQLAAQLVSHMAHQNDMEVTALFAVSDKPKHGRPNMGQCS